MEDVVAVEIKLDTDERRYFMTWGRVLDPVDGSGLTTLVLQHAAKYALGGEPQVARVCGSLAEAQGQPYFYEALIAFARQPAPFGDDYETWRRERERAMREGHDLYYLGATWGASECPICRRRCADPMHRHFLRVEDLSLSEKSADRS